MRQFVAENAKFVLDYGPYILSALILLLLIVIYLIGRRQRFLLPKNLFGWIGSLVSTFLIVIFLLATIGLAKQKQTTGKVLDTFDAMVGKEAAELSFNLVENDVASTLNDYKGKIVLLNFWATWCSPCMKEMPNLNRIQNDFEDEGVLVIALSDEKRETLLNYLEDNNMEVLPVYDTQIDWLDNTLQTARPVTFIIDRKGIIRSYYTGAREYSFFASRIKEILE